MRRSGLAALWAAGVLSLGGHAFAANPGTVVTVTASGSGSCTVSGCNNTDLNFLADPVTQAVNGARVSYGWWAFQIPIFSSILQPYETVDSVTLQIWTANGYQGGVVGDPSGGVDINAPTSTSINYATLSQQNPVAVTDFYYVSSVGPQFLTQTSDLHGIIYDGLMNALLSHQGGTLLLSADALTGGVTGDLSAFDDISGFPAPTLTVTSVVPEASEWSLLLIGFFAIGATIRLVNMRRRNYAG